jgi:hypothetical protein
VLKSTDSAPVHAEHEICGINVCAVKSTNRTVTYDYNGAWTGHAELATRSSDVEEGQQFRSVAPEQRTDKEARECDAVHPALGVRGG